MTDSKIWEESNKKLLTHGLLLYDNGKPRYE